MWYSSLSRVQLAFVSHPMGEVYLPVKRAKIKNLPALSLQTK
jgi:hypothetical protein